MKKTLSFIILFFLCLFFARAQKPVRYYVSLKGNDSFAGTIEKPFATADAARLAVGNIYRIIRSTQ
jgi:hypothetical protein